MASQERAPAATNDRRSVDGDGPGVVLDRLARRVDEDDRDLARSFATAVLRRVPPQQIAAGDPDALADEIARAFRFAAERKPGDLAVRAINPSVAVDGWSDPGTVIEICVEDRPFLLSTVTEELRSLGHDVVRSFHPILGVERDEHGRIVAFGPAREAERRETILHVEIDARLPEQDRRRIEDILRDVLRDVITVTEDFPRMRQRIEEVAGHLRTRAAKGVVSDDAAEVADFLGWLLDDNFIFLGSRIYDLSDASGTPQFGVRAGSGLGILERDDASRYDQPVALETADEGVRRRHARDAILTVARSRRTSRVHRQVRMLNVWVKLLDDDGAVVGEMRLIGLFTRKAYATPSSSIPVLGRKLDTILEREDVVEDSHDERTFVSLFEAIPKEELFELGLDELRNTLLGLLAAEERRDVRLFTRVDYFSRTVTCILAIPRDRYDATLRRSIQRLLVDRYNGASVDIGLSLGELPEAVVRFAIHVDGEIPEVSPERLEAEVQSLCRSWRYDLERALIDELGEAEGHHLYRTYGIRLPPAYRDHTPVARAVQDVLLLDEMSSSTEGLRIVLHNDLVSERSLTRLRVLKAGPGIELSSILPILESLGLTVTEELPFRLDDDNAVSDGPYPEFHIHDYGVHESGQPVDVDHDGKRLADAVLAAWHGRLEVDSLNRLVVRGELDWRWIVVLRAYRRYRRQAGTAYTAEYQNEALVSHPAVVRRLVDLFVLRFDPDRDATEEEITAGRGHVVDALEDVERLDHDRILRSFLALIDATARTNHYRGDADDLVVLKFDSARIPHMPKPVPYREIFVYSPEVEGIHLRGGRIARGGIRWSDRRDDLRTEILDLMQAQMLKNAVIVPAGAKGGFVLKNAVPGDATEVRRQYRTFISSLLDVTDNVEDGTATPPSRVRPRDGDDPYLVVAADRGTATFSDTANEMAAKHGYWLGDAFASGGSRGYDHKGLGITARGTWVAVRRHFRELGVDVQTEPVTVVGIGDMSGDVFGNGMLQSHAIRLVAAFDHRDILLDPDPDPERAFEERARLFADPALTWQDYDREAISDGGGVWSRTEKSIPLSPAIRERLRVDEEELSPPDLIRAILGAPVDLLFAGGIGTFVKASGQTSDEIGDRANDEIRIDASALRARVVGEGANLSITPPARVQYARRGGRLNADFIDNSAGVDISDHEVNLKILLQLALKRGEIDGDERDELLAAVTEDVVADCLLDVELQTWRLTQEAASSPGDMDTYEALMSHLEQLDLIDRDVEALPNTEEMAERTEAGAGLTRPELAVLLAAEKRHVFTEVLASDLPDQAGLRDALTSYFPDLLVQRFGHLLDDHPLRRELVATVVANDVVNRMGITFARRLARELGTPTADVVAAYRIARGVAAAPRLWEAAATVDDFDPWSGLDVKARLDELLEMMTRAYLRSAGLDDIAAATARDREAFEALERSLLPRTDARGARAQEAERLVEAGLDTETASWLVGVPDLAVAPDVASVARSLGREPEDVAVAFLETSTALGLERLQRLVAEIEPTDQWERWQHRGLVDDIRAIHRVAAHRALYEGLSLDGSAAVTRFLDDRRPAVEHARRLARQIETDPEAPRLAAAQVAVRAARDALRASTHRP